VSDYPLTWMAAAFRKNGLRVKGVKGWKTAGRPYSFAPKGVMFHHTASNSRSGAAPALGICVKGRMLPDGRFLPGPLCNVLIGRDGTVYLLAAGRANHAGYGGPWREIPKDSGNAYTIGVEVENDGTGEAWSGDLLETCEIVFATLLIGLKHTEAWICGHKEWASARGKIDPGGIDMDGYRRRVRRRIRAVASGSTKKPLPAEPSERPKGGDVYVVQSGDTLWSIATRHGMSVDQLMSLNELTDTLIHPGDRLKVTAR
jgi:LysM repeat protein